MKKQRLIYRGDVYSRSLKFHGPFVRNEVFIRVCTLLTRSLFYGVSLFFLKVASANDHKAVEKELRKFLKV